MELIGPSPSLTYRDPWMVYVFVLVCAALLALILLKWRHKKQQVSTRQSQQPQPPARQRTTVKNYTQAMALSDLTKLERTLHNPATDLSDVYLTLSYIIRNYSDSTKGTTTLAMSNDQVQRLNVDPNFKQVMNACYQAEFSPSAGSMAECKQVMDVAGRFIKS